MKKIIVLSLAVLLLVPLFTFARVGVGVNLGKIELKGLGNDQSFRG
ncbi:hypothetical protein KAT63_01580 [Candidatus Parcubacteria bacterium]|nr:hypothetical protein [Candidatus Parcubacteria bacterium]